MDIDINLSKIEVEINKVRETRADGILAFAEVKFIGAGSYAFVVRGYTVKQKTWGLDVDAPAHSSKTAKEGFATSFAVEPKEFWHELEQEILRRYESEDEPDDNGRESINPREIPF